MHKRTAMLGTAAEEFHLASRNAEGLKHLLNQHQIHHSETVHRLQGEVPLRLEAMARVTLPSSRGLSTHSLEDALASRVSTRAFGSTPLSGEDLSTILRMSNGIHAAEQGGTAYRFHRTAPMSGNLGSVEIFPVVLAVQGIIPGIYHFDSASHDLAQIRCGFFREWLARRVFFQQEFADAAVVLILASALARLSAKYGDRGYRLALLDVGHVSQSIYLLCAALGLPVCASAGFIDDELDRAIGLDGRNFATMLTLALGAPADES